MLWTTTDEFNVIHPMTPRMSLTSFQLHIIISHDRIQDIGEGVAKPGVFVRKRVLGESSVQLPYSSPWIRPICRAEVSMSVVWKVVCLKWLVNLQIISCLPGLRMPELSWLSWRTQPVWIWIDWTARWPAPKMHPPFRGYAPHRSIDAQIWNNPRHRTLIITVTCVINLRAAFGAGVRIKEFKNLYKILTEKHWR